MVHIYMLFVLIAKNVFPVEFHHVPSFQSEFVDFLHPVPVGHPDVQETIEPVGTCGIVSLFRQSVGLGIDILRDGTAVDGVRQSVHSLGIALRRSGSDVLIRQYPHEGSGSDADGTAVLHAAATAEVFQDLMLQIDLLSFPESQV